MKLFNKVAIVGVGLIGGSLGLAMRNKGIAKEKYRPSHRVNQTLEQGHL